MFLVTSVIFPQSNWKEMWTFLSYYIEIILYEVNVKHISACLLNNIINIII